MDRNRGLLVVAGSFALLVAGVAVTMLVKKQVISQNVERAEEIEEMIEKYEEYKAAEPKPKSKAKKARGSAARNGHVSQPIG